MRPLTPEQRLTKQFILHAIPDLTQVRDPADIQEAYLEYAGRVEDVAGPRGANDSLFDWEGIAGYVAEACDETPAELQAKNLFLKVSKVEFQIDASNPYTVESTGKGTLLSVDDAGLVQAWGNVHNPKVKPAYGDPTPYVLEKLGWAIVVDVLGHQAADRGEGYDLLTDFLRTIGRIGSQELPHVGMATTFDTQGPSGDARFGDHRLAHYASASNYTLTDSSIDALLCYPRFSRQYARDLRAKRFDNTADWLAGRLDSLIAQHAADLYAESDSSGLYEPIVPVTTFPYLDTPDYVNVDNN